MQASMEEIMRANIDRFKRLLTSETDSTKRAMIVQLLGEEEAKLQERYPAGQPIEC
jgi:hypothetical protein